MDAEDLQIADALGRRLPPEAVGARTLRRRVCSSYWLVLVCPLESCDWTTVIRAVACEIGRQIRVFQGQGAHSRAARGGNQLREPIGIGRRDAEGEDENRHGRGEPLPGVRHPARHKPFLFNGLPLQKDAFFKTRGGMTRCPGTELRLEMSPRFHVVRALVSSTGCGFSADRNGTGLPQYSAKCPAARQWSQRFVGAKSSER